MELFFSPNSGEDQKEKASPKMEHLFPRIQVDTYSQMHARVKLLGKMQMWTILKLLGGIQSNYWGMYPPFPPPPPGFGTPAIIWMPEASARKLAHYIIPCTLWCKEQVWLTFDFDF